MYEAVYMCQGAMYEVVDEPRSHVCRRVWAKKPCMKACMSQGAMYEGVYELMYEAMYAAEYADVYVWSQALY